MTVRAASAAPAVFTGPETFRPFPLLVLLPRPSAPRVIPLLPPAAPVEVSRVDGRAISAFQGAPRQPKIFIYNLVGRGLRIERGSCPVRWCRRYRRYRRYKEIWLVGHCLS